MAKKRKPRRQLCELAVHTDAARGRIHVTLLCGGKRVGELNAYDVDPITLKVRCRRALRAVEKTTGMDLVPYVVFRSAVPERLRGAGVGTAMYLAAAEGAARLGGALVQHACFSDPADRHSRGTTSLPAARVWRGARFRWPTVLSGGVVAYLPKTHWGRAVQALSFGQMRLGVPVPSPRIPNPRMPANNARRFGEALRRLLMSVDSYRIIDRYKAIHGTTWTSGSCAILALALHEWCPAFRYAAIAQDDLVHHVFARYQSFYFDADGTSTEQQMQRRWRTTEGLPRARLVRLEDGDIQDKADTAGRQIQIVPAAVTELTTFLRTSLGDPADWGFAAQCEENPSPSSSDHSTIRGSRVLDGGRMAVYVIDIDSLGHVDPVQLGQLLVAESWADG